MKRKKQNLPIKQENHNGIQSYELGNLKVITTHGLDKFIKKIIYSEFDIGNEIKKREKANKDYLGNR